MNVVILANGEAPSKVLLDRLIAASDLFVATDGAAHAAARLGVVPDIICGDFDSIDLQRAKADFPGTEFVETEDQYLGDLEKALRLTTDRGATRATIVGASGGRMDHLLGNVTLLFRYHERVEVALVDDLSETRCISGSDDTDGEWRILTKMHDLISVFSFDGLARVTISGVRWPLDDVLLPVGTLGLSNVATSDEVRVSVRSGPIVVCHTQLCPPVESVVHE